MAKFGIQAIKLNGTQFAGVEGYQHDIGLQVESEGSDGTVNETMHNIIQVRPIADLTTMAIKTWLTPSTGPLIGSSDLPYVALDGSNGLQMYGAKASTTVPGYAGSTVHRMRQAARGCIYMAGLKWSLRDYAKLALRAMFKSSSGTAAAHTDTNVALPAQVVPLEKYVLSALTIGAQSIPNVQSIDIAIDPKLDFDFNTGLPYPVDISGAGAKGHLSATMAVDCGELDVGEGTGACSAVFTNVAQGATLGSSTVTCTFNSAWSSEENFSGAQGSPIGRRLLVRTRYDGITLPFTWAVT